MSEQAKQVGQYGEPWEAKDSGGIVNIDDTVLRATDDGKPYGLHTAILEWASDAHLHRAVACVNALAGIPDAPAFVARYEAMEKAIDDAIGFIGHRGDCSLKPCRDGDCDCGALGVIQELRAALSAPSPAPKQDVTELIEAVTRLCDHADVINSENFPGWLNGLRERSVAARAATETYRKGAKP